MGKESRDLGGSAMGVRARDLVGRRIVAVALNPFRTGVVGASRSTDPIITLDNGRRLRFAVDETEMGEYGIRLVLSPRLRK